MNHTRSHTARALPVEPLERRTLITGVPTAATGTAGLRPAIIVVGGLGGPPLPATRTSLAVNAGTAGQAITFNVTVRDRGGRAAPAGTVDLVVGGIVLQALPLTPVTAAGSKHGRSTATYTVAAGAASDAYLAGRHTVTAFYDGDNDLRGSRARMTFKVTKVRDSVREFLSDRLAAGR